MPPAPDNIGTLVTRFEEHRVRVVQEIESINNSIDRLVYELYGLMEAEVGIVEG